MSNVVNDFQVRMSDVYPTGEARLIQDSAVRMRWREGGLTPVYMQPDQVYEVTASLWNTSYAIAPGHAIRFSVTSSNYPRFSANPNNGELLIQNSTNDALVVANNVFYHSAEYPSNFVLPIVEKIRMPKLHDIQLQFQQAYPGVDVSALLRGISVSHHETILAIALTASILLQTIWIGWRVHINADWAVRVLLAFS
jgi:hypothetical protein